MLERSRQGLWRADIWCKYMVFRGEGEGHSLCRVMEGLIPQTQLLHSWFFPAVACVISYLIHASNQSVSTPQTKKGWLRNCGASPFLLSFAGQGVQPQKARFSSALRPGNERCGQGAKFSYVRKFISVRTKISLRAHAVFSSFGRKPFSFRRAIFFLP